jgi:Clostripain family
MPRKNSSSSPSSDTNLSSDAKPWTILVYMAAEDETSLLDGLAIQDLNEMHAGIKDLDDSGVKDVHVLVQIDRLWPGRPQRYEILSDGPHLEARDVPETDMGSPDTLLEFLKWGADRYKDNRYFLVLWGHAFGLGFGRDHQDPLSLLELQCAIQEFRNHLPDRRPLDLLGANACAMCYVEAAHQLRNDVRYLVASQIAVPLAGWPYRSILRKIRSGIDAERVGTIVVDTYVNHFSASSAGDRVAMTLLDLGAAEQLKERVGKLTGAVTGVINAETEFAVDRRSLIRNAFLSTATGDVRPLLDLRQLCEKLGSLCGDLDTLEGPSPDYYSERSAGDDSDKGNEIGDLREAVGELEKYLRPGREQTDTVPHPENPKEQSHRPLIVFHKRHPDLDGLNGIGVFAPFVSDEADLRALGLLENESPGNVPTEPQRCKNLLRVKGVTTFETGRKTYEQFSLFEFDDPGVRWPRLVYDELRQEVGDEVLSVVGGAGANQRSAKSASAQMLISMDALFNDLDRVVAVLKIRASRHLTEGEKAVVSHVRGKQAMASFARLELFQPASLVTTLAGNANVANALMTKASINQARKTIGRVPVPTYSPPEPPEAMVDVLGSLEREIREVERAIHRTVTHPVFGLGPAELKPAGRELVNSLSKDSGGLGGFRKDSGGLGKDSGGLGAGPTKDSNLGDADTTDTGVMAPGRIDAVLASVASDSRTAAQTVLQLFREVARSLVDLESAAANVETRLAEVLAERSFAPGLFGANAETPPPKFDRAFKVLEETSIAARRTVRRVLAHPAYGFGPGPKGFGAEERRDLASLGGLSPRRLALL